MCEGRKKSIASHAFPFLVHLRVGSFCKRRGPQHRLKELAARCLVARNKIEDASDVVMGIGFNEYDPRVGTPIDLIYMRINPDDDEWRKRATAIEEDLGYFKGMPMMKSRVDEFPQGGKRGGGSDCSHPSSGWPRLGRFGPYRGGESRKRSFPSGLLCQGTQVGSKRPNRGHPTDDDFGRQLVAPHLPVHRPGTTSFPSAL